MAVGLNKVLHELSPKELNERLRQTWGISLFKFAQILAICASSSLQMPEKYVIRKAKIIRKKKLLIDLHRYILKKLGEIDSISWDFPKDVKNGQANELIKMAKLESFYEEYLNPNMNSVLQAEKEYQAHQGAKINPKSILVGAWGRLKTQGDKALDWDSLADIYEWFWLRLKDYPFYKCIEPPDDLVNYLRVQFSRYKTNRDSEYCLNHYGSREYLTIFSPTGSFVDRGFAYSHELLSLPSNKKAPLPKMPHTSEETKLFFKYALGLYREFVKDKKRFQPMIVFPDKSCLI